MARLFDTHAHLDFPDYTADLPAVLERAADAGISKIVCVGTDLESSARAIQLSEQFPAVYAVVGWHPGHAQDAPADIRPRLRELAAHPKVVAIGETGLDYYRLPSSAPGAGPDQDQAYKAKQSQLFEQQLEVASETGLNCVIHQRDSIGDTIEQVARFVGRTRAVFHCFVSDPGLLRRVLDMGSIVSFTGIVTFKNAQTVRDSLAAVPMGQFMLETDCPFLAPIPYRGKRCEPAHVRETAIRASQVKNCSLEEISDVTCRTALEFFPKLRD